MSDAGAERVPRPQEPVRLTVRGCRSRPVRCELPGHHLHLVKRIPIWCASTVTTPPARRLKGEDRPVIGELERAALLEALDCVDGVLVFGQDTPERVLSELGFTDRHPQLTAYDANVHGQSVQVMAGNDRGCAATHEVDLVRRVHGSGHRARCATRPASRGRVPFACPFSGRTGA